MTPAAARSALCRLFCEGLSVESVPVGLAVATEFLLPDGDPLTFYVRDTADGLVLEDDGDFIANAIASGLPLDSGHRGRLLEGILASEGTYLDRDTCQIRSQPVDEAGFGAAALRFLSSMIRARDLYLLTQDQVAATFADDVREGLERHLGDRFRVEEERGSDNPADFLLKDARTGLRSALVYAANSNEKLLAALLRHRDRQPGEAPVIAMLDSFPSSTISNKRFTLAQNRGLRMPIFRGNQESALDFVRDQASQGTAA